MFFTNVAGWIISAFALLGVVLDIISFFIKVDDSQKISISLKKMGVLVFFGVLLCLGVVIIKSDTEIIIDPNTTAPMPSNSVNIETISPFSKNGFIFPQSSSKYISQDDLEDLKELSHKTEYTYRELLNFSLNEIYARKGLQFTTEEFDNFYNQYPWYKNMDKKSAIEWEMFNTYEKHNLTLIINEQISNGFRKP